jgi:hypothetical protein
MKVATCRYCKDEFDPKLKKKGFIHECDDCADEDIPPPKAEMILDENDVVVGLKRKPSDWKPELPFNAKVILQPKG